VSLVSMGLFISLHFMAAVGYDIGVLIVAAQDVQRMERSLQRQYHRNLEILRTENAVLMWRLEEAG